MKSKRFLSALLALTIMVTSAFLPTINVVAESSSSTAAEEAGNAPETSTNVSAAQPAENEAGNSESGADTNGENSSGTQNVAEVNGTQYTSLQAAIDAADSGAAVTLICDLEERGTETEANLGEYFVQILSKNITIDFGGKIFKGSFYLNSESTVKFVNGTITTLEGNKSSGIESVGGSIELTDMTVFSSARHAVRVKGGSAVINSGTYETQGTGTNHTLNISHGSTVTVNGGTFIGNRGYSTSGGNAVMIQDVASDVIINGGIFKNASGVEGCICAAAGLLITGGSFDTWTYNNYLAEAYTASKLADGTFSVIKTADAVAKVGEVYYATLQAAIDAVSENGTVTLLCDITPTEQLLINKSLTLDLGEYTITGNSAEAVLRIYAPVYNTTIDVTIDATTGGVVNTGSGYAIYAGEDIDGGTDSERTNLTVEGGNYSTNGSDCIRQIMGLCTVNDGTYKSSFSRTVLNGKQWYGSEFKINGGSFYGFNPACVSVWTGFNGNDYTNFYHQHDIIAEGKTAEFKDGWYTVVVGANVPKVEAKSLCYPSVASAIHAIIEMNDVANLGTITLLADDTLTTDDVKLAMDYGFSFILGEYTLTLSAGYELYDTVIDGNRSVAKIRKTLEAEVNGTKYEFLADAIDAASDGDTVTLLDNLTIDDIIKITKSITIYLNGKTITVEYSGSRPVQINTDSVSLTIDGTAEGSTVLAPNGLVQIDADNVTLTVNGGYYFGGTDINAAPTCVKAIFKQNTGANGNITLNNVNVDTGSYVFDCATGASNVTLLVSGGEYTSCKGSKSDYLFGTLSGGGMTFENVKITSDFAGGIYAQGGTAVLTDCTFTVRGTNAASAVTAAYGAVVTINGGSFSSTAYGVQILNSGATVNINGTTEVSGTKGAVGIASKASVTSTLTISDGKFTGGIEVVSAKGTNNITITGGMFDIDAWNDKVYPGYISDGYHSTEADSEEYYLVEVCTGADAVEENIVDATCTENGSYDSVVYCSVCGEELSRGTITIDALGHTADTAVPENIVEATPAVPGTYDEVVYCSVCGDELERTEGVEFLHENGFATKVFVARWYDEDKGMYQFWIFAGIDTLEYEKVGFIVTTDDGRTNTFEVTKVYTSVTDSTGETYYADDFSTDNYNTAYIFGVGITVSLEYAMETAISYKPYAVTLEGETIYGLEYSKDTIYKAAQE